MTTQDFIAKNIGKTPKQDRFCSSVFQSTRGDFYSYGYHYPLLFKVGAYWFINTQGYSSSTGKHIGWAKGAIDYKYHAVKLTRYSTYNIAHVKNYTIETITAELTSELNGYKTRLKALSKRAWRQREYLLADIAKVKQTIKAIN